MQYCVQADSIPQYIVMMEDAQKKAKQAGMPIADVKLVMLASAAVITAQHFLHKVYNWEGLPVAEYTWRAWKVAFRITHIQRQRQLQAMGGGGKPLGGAHAVLPAPGDTINHLGAALHNLALAALNDTTVLQQLTAANLTLTTTNTSLTTANKKLSEALASLKGAPPLARTPGPPCKPNAPHVTGTNNATFPGN